MKNILAVALTLVVLVPSTTFAQTPTREELMVQIINSLITHIKILQEKIKLLEAENEGVIKDEEAEETKEPVVEAREGLQLNEKNFKDGKYLPRN